MYIRCSHCMHSNTSFSRGFQLIRALPKFFSHYQFALLTFYFQKWFKSSCSIPKNTKKYLFSSVNVYFPRHGSSWIKRTPLSLAFVDRVQRTHDSHQRSDARETIDPTRELSKGLCPPAFVPCIICTIRVSSSVGDSRRRA